MEERMASRKALAAPGKRFSPKQLAFIAAYCADPSQSVRKAAIKAGYKESSAETTGWELLNLPQYAHVRREVDRKNQDRLAALGATDEKTWRHLCAIAYGDIRKVISWGLDQAGQATMSLTPSEELWPEEAAMIKEIKHAEYSYGKSVTVKMADKLGALQTIAKMQGLLKEQVQVEQHDSLEKARESLKSALAELATPGVPGAVDQPADPGATADPPV